MDITKAVIYLNGTAITTIESATLVRLAGNEDSDGACLDYVRQLLYGTFAAIHEDDDIEIIFPELEAL